MDDSTVIPIRAQAVGIWRAPRSGFRPPACTARRWRDDTAATSAPRGLSRVWRGGVLRVRRSRRALRGGSIRKRGAAATQSCRCDDAVGGHRGGGRAARARRPVIGRWPVFGRRRRTPGRYGPARGHRFTCILTWRSCPRLAGACRGRCVSPTERARPAGGSTERTNRDTGERYAPDGERCGEAAALGTVRVRIRALRSARWFASRCDRP